ncbi:FadR/GntR family transcriptional regulator [Streptosporangium amethystogenes subsp. fukuiense]|uniref:FadR/GntR family transcriptional regulator n=1 Tax=Streptosporangium amethystogenes subsp. fukuiense TaxID=698418 RepID=A0ABW2SX42_9ACTN
MDERAARGEAFIEQDREFHLLLMEPLGNELVTQLTAAFWDVHAIVAHTLDATPESVRETVEAHHAIVTAAAGDVAAFTRAIAAHYAPIQRRLQEEPGRQEPAADA